MVGLLYSTDLLDLGETTVRLFADRVSARPRLLGILTLLVALALIANVVRLAPAVARRTGGCRRRESWRPHAYWPGAQRPAIRPGRTACARARCLGAVALFAYLTILPDITPDVGNVLRITTRVSIRWWESHWWRSRWPQADTCWRAGGQAGRTCGRSGCS